jgi:hypothetical protein
VPNISDAALVSQLDHCLDDVVSDVVVGCHGAAVPSIVFGGELVDSLLELLLKIGPRCAVVAKAFAL